MSAAAAIDDIWAEFAETRQKKLRDELIIEYTPFVRFVVGRLGIPPTSLLEMDDLLSYGTIGLINAIERFDPARGIRFEAFATPRIRGAVIDHLRTLNWLPRTAVSRVRQIEQALAGLEQRLGRPAKEEEVAVELGVSIERYRQMLLDASTTVLSIDVPLNALQNDETMPLRDLLEDRDTPGPDEEAERRELVTALSSAIDHLPEREQLLLALYYQEELTMKEISKIMSVSESRVCQLHMQTIMRLRGLLHAQKPGESEAVASKQAIKSRRKQKTSVHNTLSTHTTGETEHAQDTEVVVGGKHKRRVS
ncbi:MAG TPA: FliA/WhiG family RNA polymerase sigma factor [Ktedonobacteraceae bacterium]|nr:FliA/WhiG family RNA polymerase sigma factor [Ktedonobacteraceae bacterium]